MNCDFASCGEKRGRAICCCQREGCGRAMYGAPEDCHAICPVIPRDREAERAAAKAAKRERKKQLGDKIEAFLTSYGVTKEWWIEFKDKWGLPPECSCDARAAWFTALGERFPWFGGIAGKLLEYLTRE